MKTKLEIIPGRYRVCEEKHDNGTLIIRSDPKGDADVPGDLVVALIVGGAPEPYDRNTAELLASAPEMRAAIEESLECLKVIIAHAQNLENRVPIKIVANALKIKELLSQ